MPFTDLERAGGKPVEVYHFTYGTTHWRWTSSDAAIMVAGATYLPEPLTRGSIEMNEEARTGTVDVRAPSSNDVVRLFAKSQPYTPITVQIFRVQRDDPDLVAASIFSGQVESCKFSPRTGTLHCTAAENVTTRKLATLLYQTTCNNELFDHRCQVDPTYFTYSYDVAEISDPNPSAGLGFGVVLESAAATFFYGDLEGILIGGIVRFGTQRQTIIGHTGAQIYLLRPLDDLLIGSTLELSAGCPKTVDACRDTFNNLLRFNGFPHIPQKNPFEGTGGLS